MSRDCLPVMTCPGNSCNLDYNPNDKYGYGNENAVLSGNGLGNKSRQESPQPGTELEDGSEPALLGLIRIRVDRVVFAHVCGSRLALHLSC